jgi:N-acetylglucosaminyldiphosphoundecaprenol N-acetyl-beta-D-mannosaminyltransferase
MKIQTVPLLNVPIANISLEEYKKLLSFLMTDKSIQQQQIALVNSEFLLWSEYNKEHKNILQNKVFYNIPDGIGLVWASKFLSLKIDSVIKIYAYYFITLASILFFPKFIYKNNPLQQRLPAIICNHEILKAAEKNKVSIFLLGGTEEIIKKTVSIIQKKYPKIIIKGYENGYGDWDKATEKVNRLGAEVVIVARGGGPEQEIYISKALKKWKKVKLAIGVGGWFDQIAGKQSIAPSYIRILHLEWLYRAFKERRFKRAIWDAVFHFSYRVLQYKITTLKKQK